MRDRLVQLACLAVLVAGSIFSGNAVPSLLEQANKEGLRYTADPVEGAPPIVALGTAIGAFRGVLADYLWIKLQAQKEQGQFYEAMADADLITKLQPRFAEVWGFHGHNMAYNISVLTNTPEERWSWVKAGIDLVRNKGLRYNPNDLGLNKELAFWFAHKIDGVSDDAHLYYKREFAKEWQYVLGVPPYDQAEREKWMRAIANAPGTIEELEQKNPAVRGLVDQLTAEFSPFDKQFRFKLDREFLLNLGKWMAVKTSPYAKILNLEAKFKSNDPIFVAFDRVLTKPELRGALVDLLLYLRKRTLLDDYNMDPAKMADFTRDFGPLDWRHPQAHAFYWSRLGAEQGEKRYGAPDDAYKVMNNDRMSIQAMQAMNHSGLVAIDPFSNDNPTRLQDNRWIKSIEKYFLQLYQKHYGTRGAGSDTFCDFHENFMAQAIRQLFRVGDYAGAQEILEHLDKLYGTGGLIPSDKYTKSLEDFVRDTTYGEYEMVPDVARTDVYAVLQRGFREGLLLGRKKILEESLKFAKDLTDYFQGNRYTDFVNKFGEKRMADLVGDIRRSVEDVLIALVRDNNQPLLDRLTIYNQASEEQRRMVYDAVKEQIEMEFKESPLAEAMTFAKVFPEPPEMEAYRALQAEAARVRQESIDNQNRSQSEKKMSPPEIPPAIFAIGRNYSEHAQEMGGAVDPNPIVFMKNPACVVADGQAIVIPAICENPGPQVDWEGELAIEIGATCRNVKERDALGMVRAYRAANDVSARWWQKQGSGGQFCRGKSFDTFCPLSQPTRADRVPDPQNLRIITRVNGQVMQDASTAGMFHSVAKIIATLSDGTTLLAGTLILTGSPAGVGAARKPPIFLKDGDVVEVEIPGVGRVRNPVQSEK